MFTAVLEYSLLLMVVKFKWYCYQTAGVKEMLLYESKNEAKPLNSTFTTYLHFMYFDLKAKFHCVIQLANQLACWSATC